MVDGALHRGPELLTAGALSRGAVVLCAELKTDRPRHVVATIASDHPGALADTAGYSPDLSLERKIEPARGSSKRIAPLPAGAST